MIRSSTRAPRPTGIVRPPYQIDRPTIAGSTPAPDRFPVHQRRRLLHPTPGKAAGGVGSLVGQSRETHLDLGRHRLKKRPTKKLRPLSESLPPVRSPGEP